MYASLKNAVQAGKSQGLKALFESEGSQRYINNHLHAAGFTYDFSRCHINQNVKDALFEILDEHAWATKRKGMFDAEQINSTEGREVLHIALRDLDGHWSGSYGADKHEAVKSELDRMADFADAVRAGEIQGAGGKKITDVVNIGIGGSDLGPLMATRALRPYHDGPRTHFVSNIDAAALADVLADLDPATTMIAIASKTFTTLETLVNAKTAIAWARQKLSQEQVNRQLIALTSNKEGAEAFGVQSGHIFGFWDWVGGRFSLWSSIGLSMMVAIGPDHFRQFLQGAHKVDRHFVEAPARDNIPVMMALMTVLHRNGLEMGSQAIIPYEDRLARLPAYLQQLEMESNGKSVDFDGTRLETQTCPVVWGEPGTNGQHAFFQLLHQGTEVIPVEFIMGLKGHEMGAEAGTEHHRRWLVANCLAQAEALMYGKTPDQVREEGVAEALVGHKTFEGNRPSTLLSFERLDPSTLGGLIALYEHKVFTLGHIWNINSFDQWGVELGKVLAKTMHSAIETNHPAPSHDVSTRAVLERLKA